MERFVWKGRVQSGKLSEYIKKHDEIWSEMVDLMHRAGMRNYSIWNNDLELIGYYEFDGPEKKQQVYREHRDVLDKWTAHMGGIMEMDRDANGSVLVYKQVFLME